MCMLLFLSLFKAKKGGGEGSRSRHGPVGGALRNTNNNNTNTGNTLTLAHDCVVVCVV